MGVETIDERDETDIEVNEPGGRSPLTSMGKSQGGWQRANDKDGSM
jgi:hypothetical protein